MSVRKLNFDTIPQGMVRSLPKTHKSLWKKIRDARFADSVFVCDVCEARKTTREEIDGHEMWDCRPTEIVLIRVLFICKLCHDAIHLERLRGKRSSPDYLRTVEAHYCEQNGIAPDELKQDYAAMRKRNHEIFMLYKGVPPRMNYGPYDAEAKKAEGRKRAYDDTAPFEQYPNHEFPWDMGHAD